MSRYDSIKVKAFVHSMPPVFRRGFAAFRPGRTERVVALGSGKLPTPISTGAIEIDTRKLPGLRTLNISLLSSHNQLLSKPGRMKESEKKKPVAQSNASGYLLTTLVLGVTLFIVGSSFLMTGIHAVNAVRLIGDHEVVTGVVYQSSISRRDSSKYQFQIDGVVYKGFGRMERNGESIDVAYSPKDPHVNRPLASLYSDVLIPLLTPVILIGGACWIYRKNRWRRELRAEILERRARIHAESELRAAA